MLVERLFHSRFEKKGTLASCHFQINAPFDDERAC
jgi:hypothetical protein